MDLSRCVRGHPHWRGLIIHQSPDQNIDMPPILCHCFNPHSSSIAWSSLSGIAWEGHWKNSLVYQWRMAQIKPNWGYPYHPLSFRPPHKAWLRCQRKWPKTVGVESPCANCPNALWWRCRWWADKCEVVRWGWDDGGGQETPPSGAHKWWANLAKGRLRSSQGGRDLN